MTQKVILPEGSAQSDSAQFTLGPGEEAVVGLFCEKGTPNPREPLAILRVTPGFPAPALDDAGLVLTLTKPCTSRRIRGPITAFVRRSAGSSVGVFVET